MKPRNVKKWCETDNNMSKARGFLEVQRRDPGYRPKELRTKDYRAVELRLTDEELYQQARRCMDCGTPFCHGCGCPLNNVIPEFNDHVFNHRWKDALDILLATNPFPEFMGRICPALCEGSCVLGINAEPVTIRQIELAIIEKGFELDYITPRPPQSRNGMNVAIIGSGPAGLATAEILNKHGYSVVVYENHAKAGGILRYGIPEFKLEKWVVDRRIKLMQDEGVVFETGVEVGKDLSYRFLQSRFKAIVLTGGAREPRSLKIPGRELKGIHYAMTYLIQQNKRLGCEAVRAEEEILAKDKTVVVIGGGDTGADCLGTALRQGAKKVYQFEILPKPPEKRDVKTPWPMWPNMLRESSSHKEGGERRWCIDTKEFIGENGHVKRMRCVEVEWISQQNGGAPTPKEKPGTEFMVDADLVLLAMGFIGPGRTTMVEELGVELDRRGFVKRDENNMTNIPAVFVAGDMTRGASLVVRAIADGIQTAHGVMAYLK
jgi:glutamate synthase (NADPH/NADH) small chain